MKELMKLYDKMTPTEQAIVGFACIANHDEDGFERVMSKVPRGSYTETHHEWQYTLDRLLNFSKIYAWTYWELRAYLAECVGLAGIYMSKANRLYRLTDEKSFNEACEFDEKSDKYREEAEGFKLELRALHQAAKDVCESHGYPLEEIKRLAGLSAYKLDEGETTPEYIEKYTGLFQAVCG